MRQDWGFGSACLFKGNTGTTALLNTQKGNKSLQQVKEYLNWEGRKFKQLMPAAGKLKQEVQKIDCQADGIIREYHLIVVAHAMTFRGHMGKDKSISRLYPHFVLDHMYASKGWASNKRSSTSYHHNTVAEAERFASWLKTALAVYVNHNQQTWDKFLPLIVHTYNCSVHPATRFTPDNLLQA
ncbi:hypothetical protein BDK51DRAFT_28803 [Blyttiomyces helicus]|uniref:Integrase catalytic domain-containing protein n=1 Tax=Blyttiomyces helicus TaxID=388810 RepID=A0A4P9WSK0_9FUNG|nr:hypothetical protein BDK51DRAFT_28803 [Blyttiomyces helicus]|eukprot:RKO94280.1 hypothetical protein BDK51DRAFT_28803 [Blyttiomyces helicus]